MRKRPLLFLLSLSLVILPAAPLVSESVIRVGVPQNKPMAFMDGEGQAQGISVDILNHVAGRENWTLRYIPCSWQQCLQELERGKLDLLIDIAYSTGRAARFSFGSEAILVNWGVAYTRKDFQLDTVLDLEEKTVAVMAGGIYNKKLRQLAESFRIRCTFAEVGSYQQVLQAVERQEADAGIVSRFFGQQYEGQSGLRPSTFIFGPVELRFAASRGADPSLTQTIDRYLKALKEDKKSLYYQSLNRWLGELRIEVFPRWLLWVLIALSALVAAAILLIFLLKAVVRSKTAELAAGNRQLLAEVDRRRKTEQQLQRLNRAYKILSCCRPTLPRPDSESRYLEQICQTIVDSGKYRLAWIGFVQEGDRSKAVRPVAWKGFNGEYVKKLDITWADSERGRGPTGTAIRTGTPSICRNIPSDPAFAPWREEAMKYGYASSIAIPLRDNGKPFGALNIYSSEPDAFDPEEVRLLRELAARLGNGIKSLRMQAEHRQDKEALLRSEEKYREMVENLNDIIFALDSENTVTYISPVIEPLSGYSPQEIIGRSFADFIYPEDLPDLNRSLQKVLSGSLEPLEYRVLTKSGETRWVRSSSRPMYQDGRIVGLRGILTDITEQRNLEEQFLKSQKMEAIARLTGGIAHDFNNVLTAILGYSELLANRLENDEELHPHVQEIVNAADRAASLIRQLLAFSRKQVLQPKVLDLNKQVQDMQKLLKRLIGEDIRLSTRLDPQLGLVKVDPSQIEQVLMNLAVNARDALPEGGQLTIETSNVVLDEQYARDHVSAAPGPYILLSVSDNGSGMDKETQTKIFDPFFTTKELGKGTGLGLSTVYGIVKQSGGNIWVYSEPGLGTTFKIYLPRVDALVETEQKTRAARKSTGGTETILLVEDEDMVRELIELGLTRDGYSVLESRSPREALELCRRHEGPIHLLITDIIMPEMSGRDLAEQMQTMYPEVRVLYMSGYTDDVIVHHGILEAGIDYLQKPFGPGALSQKVREILDSGPI
jgi:PAS domain S-box-containing protein